jgi:4-amino-4-deoxy-L-arabinose transferase-like glycosyltransferase
VSSGAAYGWLGFALALFLLQAVPYLSHRWVTDESWYAGPAFSIAHGHGVRDPAIGPNDLENHFDARPPGTALVIASAFKAFGAGPVEARLGSVIAGLMIVALVYWLARDVLGWQGAVVAMLVVGTDNLIVLAARTARPEALTVMAALAALAAVKRYWRGGELGWAFGAGLLMAGATMFHVTVLGYIVAAGLLLIVADVGAKRIAVRGALAYAAGFLVGLVPFATWILAAPLGRAGFRQEFLSRAVNTSLLGRIVGEGRRYSDILGFNMMHGHGLEALPVRLPIPLCFLAATVLLWRLRRRWFYIELLLLVPSVLWLVYTVNKSSRYIALLAPIFALAMGAAVSAARGHRWTHRVALGLACVAIAAQAGANFVLLRAAGKADYERVGAGLRALVPPGQTAYGSITFWLDFRDRSYISYERTSPWMAARQYHARYFILGDRVMMNGSFGDGDFYRQLNHELAEVTAHSSIVGHVTDPYYGDLSVYKLDQ